MSEKSKQVKTSFYIVFKAPQSGRYPYKRVLKAARILQSADTSPSLHSGEVAIRANVTLPAALFDRPVLDINIAMDGEALPDLVIDAETQEGLQEAIRAQLGQSVHVSIDAPPPTSNEMGAPRGDWTHVTLREGGEWIERVSYWANHAGTKVHSYRYESGEVWDTQLQEWRQT